MSVTRTYIPAQPDLMLEPKFCNCSYLAGLLDGQGNIGIYSRGIYGSAKPRLEIEIKISNEPTIDWLVATFGGTKVFRRGPAPYHLDQWRWRIAGKKAVHLYAEIKPLLKIRLLPSDGGVKSRKGRNRANR